MARIRAIEGGFAVVRSVRWAASAAFDARGRVRAWMPAVDDNDGIMMARVPVMRTPTVASVLGDLPIAFAAAILAGMLALAARRRPPRIAQEPVSPR
jgi:apolipoprotein N-acyltransferase